LIDFSSEIRTIANGGASHVEPRGEFDQLALRMLVAQRLEDVIAPDASSGSTEQTTTIRH
jgi:hypothetical protein